jgi:hypothetical protein
MLQGGAEGIIVLG